MMLSDWAVKRRDSYLQLARTERRSAQLRRSGCSSAGSHRTLGSLASARWIFCAAVKQRERLGEAKPGTCKHISLAWETQRRLKFLRINQRALKVDLEPSPKASTSFPLLPSVFPENRTQGTAPIVTRNSKFRMKAAELQPALAIWCKLLRLSQSCWPRTWLVWSESILHSSSSAFLNKDDATIQINVIYSKHTGSLTLTVFCSPHLPWIWSCSGFLPVAGKFFLLLVRGSNAVFL